MQNVPNVVPTHQLTENNMKPIRDYINIVSENFADGRNPQDKGDSARHGIPKHATLATLDKMTHAGGRKGQLAHWQANMRRGRAKNEGEGDPEGVEHLSKELISHIIQQVGTEGAHAIVKSLQWGDGAAKELLQLIVSDLKNDIGMAESVKQRLDPKCWKGKHKEGTKIKGGVRVNNCVPNEGVDEPVDEYRVVHDQNKVPHVTTARDTGENYWNIYYYNPDGSRVKLTPKGPVHSDKVKHAKLVLAALLKKRGFPVSTSSLHAEPARAPQSLSMAEANELFDQFEQYVAATGLDEGVYETYTDEQIISETAAWQRKAGKNRTGGLNAKGVASYRREHPGSKLQTAVTTKPSKLKPGSKAAKRRKSFCARMGGMKGPMKDEHGKPTRKALSLRKWNCESKEQGKGNEL